VVRDECKSKSEKQILFEDDNQKITASAKAKCRSLRDERQKTKLTAAV
jgi:hypothetical protein